MDPRQLSVQTEGRRALTTAKSIRYSVEISIAMAEAGDFPGDRAAGQLGCHGGHSGWTTTSGRVFVYFSPGDGQRGTGMQ